MSKSLPLPQTVVAKISKLNMMQAKAGNRFSITEFVNHSEYRFKIIQEVVAHGDGESLALAVELMGVFFDLNVETDKQAYYDIGIIEPSETSTPKAAEIKDADKYMFGARS